MGIDSAKGCFIKYLLLIPDTISIIIIMYIYKASKPGNLVPRRCTIKERDV